MNPAAPVTRMLVGKTISLAPTERNQSDAILKAPYSSKRLSQVIYVHLPIKF